MKLVIFEKTHYYEGQKKPRQDINGENYLTNIAYDSVVFGLQVTSLNIADGIS
jgi:hypothetical protein